MDLFATIDVDLRIDFETCFADVLRFWLRKVMCFLGLGSLIIISYFMVVDEKIAQRN
jgi:hypothetical protein